MDSPSHEPPSFSVRIGEEAARHIRDKHVNDPYESPLWADFLGPEQDLPTALGPAIQGSFARPFYLEYAQHDEAGAFLHHTREFVTRAGFVAVVCLTGADDGDLVTAYFPYETFDARPGRRWLGARESRIKLYAVRVTYGLAQSRFAPPSETDVFPSEDPAGERRNLRFVNDERWGVRTVPLGDSEVRVFGSPPPWPER
jgi:hypothetical protein